MSYLDDARRWIKDQLANDQYAETYGSETPRHSMRTLSGALPSLAPAQRLISFEALNHFATVYYEGRHNEPIPFDVQSNLSEMYRRMDRLNRVDAARERLRELGGPPTSSTISDAIARSLEERERQTIDHKHSINQPSQVEVEAPTPVEDQKQRHSHRDSPTPWMAQSGGADSLSPKHLASAQHSYSNWEYKDRYSFSDYVSYTQQQWSETIKQSQDHRQSMRMRMG